MSKSKMTNNPQELEKIANLTKQVLFIGIIEATLYSGAVLEGVFRTVNTGNNASSVSDDGQWLYYGNFDIETLDRQLINIDMCDVKSIRDVTSQKKESYISAGF